MSTNNQIPGVDEGNLMAYEDGYIYIALGGTFKIVRTNEDSLTLVHNEFLPPAAFAQAVLVRNGYIALILQYNFFVPET